MHKEGYGEASVAGGLVRGSALVRDNSSECELTVRRRWQETGFAAGSLDALKDSMMEGTHPRSIPL